MMLVVKVSRFRPGQLEPEAVVATTDQAICQAVLRLIRERLAREEEQDGLVSKPTVRRTDD
ncbi:hypothetical protein [Thermomicrobium roseum]|uniref:Uncharacterized protein n=1 Tax=Thermomicrobium roseum (strain ATCC 27502 / DSM 5159 / P-2) TaxID=309801 RepID=B9KYK6_THERP|nr:hypothetical protein [Thermomicrobium roseum]ACM06307.1 hypothetical protein trd_0552 [Thermomicrobium roseum DSM 5159]